MTIREAGKEIEFTGKMVLAVGFNGNDETELDVESLEELEDLWTSLCPEFETTEDSVDYVQIAY